MSRRATQNPRGGRGQDYTRQVYSILHRPLQGARIRNRFFRVSNNTDGNNAWEGLIATTAHTTIPQSRFGRVSNHPPGLCVRWTAFSIQPLEIIITSQNLVDYGMALVKENNYRSRPPAPTTIDGQRNVRLRQDEKPGNVWLDPSTVVRRSMG